jgi:hypothetical protein
MLGGQRFGPHTSALLIDCPECSRDPILGRLLSDHTVALPRLAPDMQEAKEGKRRGHCGLAAWRGGHLYWTKVNHLGLVRVELQPVLAQSLLEHGHHAIRILFAAKKRHKVIGETHEGARSAKAWLDLVDKPSVQNIVQKYVS